MTRSEFEAERPVQFSLWELFFLLTIVGVYCSVVRSMGHYIAGLFTGVVAQFVILRVMRTSNLLASALSGGILAIIFMMLSAYLCNAFGTAEFFASALIYPSAGFVAGIVSASYEFQRTGI
jgi:hypothetical protein